MIKFENLNLEKAPIYGEYDVVVVGGGMAGVGAAVAAGRSGKNNNCRKHLCPWRSCYNGNRKHSVRLLFRSW